MVKDVAFVFYSVRDVPRAREFYRDVMGLTPGLEYGDHWVEFDVGSIAFGIGNGESLGIAPGSSYAMMFEVDDVAAERERLEGLGVSITDVSEAPTCWSAFVTDPEGNKFGLHQRKGAAASGGDAQLADPRVDEREELPGDALGGGLGNGGAGGAIDA